MHLTLKKETTRPPRMSTPRQRANTSVCRTCPIPSTTATSSSPAADDLPHRKKINLSTVLAGQSLGIKEVDEGIWLVSFVDYDLNDIDLEQKTLQPLDNHLRPEVVTHVIGTIWIR